MIFIFPQVSYLYSNRRFFVPFGWWANPVPAASSTAWALLVERGFNPFQLKQLANVEMESNV